jgi:hypothetical protein
MYCIHRGMHTSNKKRAQTQDKQRSQRNIQVNARAEERDRKNSTLGEKKKVLLSPHVVMTTTRTSMSTAIFALRGFVSYALHKLTFMSVNADRGTSLIRN